MVRCTFCGREVDPNSKLIWRRVEGWERKGFGGSRRGGSDIALRHVTDEVACPACIEHQRMGLSVSQLEL